MYGIWQVWDMDSPHAKVGQLRCACDASTWKAHFSSLEVAYLFYTFSPSIRLDALLDVFREISILRLRISLPSVRCNANLLAAS